jgi:thiol:disulfide interchange protein
MKNLLILIATISFLLSNNTLQAQKVSQGSQVNFYAGSYNNFLREVRKQNKIAILDFWASWCAPCQKLDEETFSNPELAAYINQNFLVYKVNVDTFDGMEVANRFEVESFPTLIKLNSRGRLEEEWKGFFPANYLTEMLRNSSKSSPI